MFHEYISAIVGGERGTSSAIPIIHGHSADYSNPSQGNEAGHAKNPCSYSTILLVQHIQHVKPL